MPCNHFRGGCVVCHRDLMLQPCVELVVRVRLSFRSGEERRCRARASMAWEEQLEVSQGGGGVGG
eukprot:1040560-Pleurochrysis_carterae.AAC.1